MGTIEQENKESKTYYKLLQEISPKIKVSFSNYMTRNFQTKNSTCIPKRRLNMYKSSVAPFAISEWNFLLPSNAKQIESLSTFFFFIKDFKTLDKDKINDAPPPYFSFDSRNLNTIHSTSS